MIAAPLAARREVTLARTHKLTRPVVAFVL
jgi:hypothetical protein